MRVEVIPPVAVLVDNYGICPPSCLSLAKGKLDLLSPSERAARQGLRRFGMGIRYGENLTHDAWAAGAGRTEIQG